MSDEPISIQVDVRGIEPDQRFYDALGELAAAASAMSEGLRRYTAALGVPEKYHETVTLAWLFLINERRARCEDAADRGGWQAFRRANPDLFAAGGRVLDRYYRPDTLASPLARRVFVLPDRAIESPAGDARAA